MVRTEKRYFGIIILILVMLVIHLEIILIHPLLFIVWPLCLWLVIELIKTWRNDRRLLVFAISFTGYVIITQFLVVENRVGIFFDQEPFPNMAILTNSVLIIASLIYLYDVSISKRGIKKDSLTFVGFASIIPWIGPAFIEALILFRWSIEGTFAANTVGKGIGAASLDDILFTYGFRNFLASTIIAIIMASLMYSQYMLETRLLNIREKRREKRENEKWLRNAWENPESLLSAEALKEFKETYGNLDHEEQRRLLLEKMLPEKGINLSKPDS